MSSDSNCFTVHLVVSCSMASFTVLPVGFLREFSLTALTSCGARIFDLGIVLTLGLLS